MLPNISTERTPLPAATAPPDSEVHLPDSKLETELVTAKLTRRPMSLDVTWVQRHAYIADLEVDELALNYDLDTGKYPLSRLKSPQELFTAVEYREHLNREDNFLAETNVECLSIEGESGAPNTSWGNAIPMAQASVEEFFDSLSLSPAFLVNLLGRPDYWAPKKRWEKSASDGSITACVPLRGGRNIDFYCQHPRWNLQVQGAPLSAYMRHDLQHGLTVYVISHKQRDTSVAALQSLLKLSLKSHRDGAQGDEIGKILTASPLDLHVMLSYLSFEASKYHVKRFQRFMWEQVNKVDNYLAGLESSDRSKLGNLTKQLQIISQNADSHIANATVALFTARGIKDMTAQLNGDTSASSQSHITDQSQSTLDTISYIIHSMEKQQAWFENYKERKNSTMNLVYNLVTQQDAANNIGLAASMKRDSTSMNAIAALTMVFLPATAVATPRSTRLTVFETER
ncbi:hypothetical protein N7495_004242 [Penicillium taxi]|uniref:uncharacterized protein n=1 Tax=Penicillium taxi TaxID=168475 RepID=UPI002544E3BE|nr:uncharacterized protein N7495_004242 [Penicillium taxi]KAJ5899498.1 hypothetical protein N7495_004242 [Penicillium taxi]